jgi:hypothetical protein
VAAENQHAKSFVRLAHPLGAAPENPVYIDFPGLEVPIPSFKET